MNSARYLIREHVTEHLACSLYELIEEQQSIWLDTFLPVQLQLAAARPSAQPEAL